MPGALRKQKRNPNAPYLPLKRLCTLPWMAWDTSLRNSRKRRGLAKALRSAVDSWATAKISQCPACCRHSGSSEVLARELRDYVRGIRGYLFATALGKPLQQRIRLTTSSSISATGTRSRNRWNPCNAPAARFWPPSRSAI